MVGATAFRRSDQAVGRVAKLYTKEPLEALIKPEEIKLRIFKMKKIFGVFISIIKGRTAVHAKK